jgi:hypothetical protein
MRKLFFPVPLYLGIEIVRGNRSLESAGVTANHNLIGYTDRAVAVLERRRAGEDGEVCLVVCKLPENVFNEILMGDWQHFGPCAHWRTPHVLEFEPGGYGRFRHEGFFSMEVIKN